jgi:hypothetical protein
MWFEARCQSIEGNNGIIRVLLVVESSPSSQDEHLLCNLLQSRMDFDQGDVVEVIIRKKSSSISPCF